MSYSQLLKITDHRPWKIPDKDWKFYQEWNHAIFLHWQTDHNELRNFVPPELELDLYNEKPWISLVAFTMQKIRPKYLPPFRPVSNFFEINIRTYVTYKKKAGVYFLSIEGGKRLSCKIARWISGLPYRYSRMERSQNHFQSFNKIFKDRFQLNYHVGQKSNDKNVLDRWLTERYALFQDTQKTINSFDIHHLEWSLNEIEIKEITLNYERFHKLLKGKPDTSHYSQGVKVLAWNKY